jgi:hypothetical protein
MGNMLKSSKNKPDNIKNNYESAILNPQYYSLNGNDQKFFIEADSANKNKESIELKKISGNFGLPNDITLYFNAKHGAMNLGAKKIILSDDIAIKTNDGGELHTSKLLIEYDSNHYSLSSDNKIELSYKNIAVTAGNFSFHDEELLKFSGSVRVTIKNH